jgi:RNase adaptor protein for sRNA GlmZ degradation
VLGAYGFRGLIEKKPHFLLSIPGALENLRWWLANVSLPVRIPELSACLHSLSGLEKYKLPAAGPEGRLTVAISSFSYKNGIPDDHSGHGGGFVFDCRALPNPGREERYRSFTGRDKIIINYLGNDPEVKAFLDNVQKLLVQSVDNYLERKFDRISVQFGCTGGQHRSVYCAERTASFLKEKYPQVILTLNHPMLNS